ncbi:type II secretion system minor pseudopilin GspI [Endozoicomonas sp. SCSIO W0465]|uniref:type II secretion system minor pseudopilin GspI n=1 Tax=Endozoicomonas sp. SCSIO W0465 TaxID=2918516 RepID=UPI00207634BC|nr:type II secretion system minor pseudopilin GspI [Endozoicomonas sp. SCSIO W0465]USE38812.1 type II secretion system minor pseudopilin GspI [Endozoicomonas sp. SCSIO W0465]
MRISMSHCAFRLNRLFLRNRIQNGCHGFTLLEVMVALAVFSLAASMLILSDGNSIRQTRYQKEKILASQIADHYLNVLHAEGRWSGPAVRPHIESYAGYQWYVRETSVSTDSPDFRKVQVEVFIGESEPEKGATPLARLSTWLRRPRQ